MNDIMPRVSVGLPVYNGDDFLAETLESILAQTFTDFELIISDNGSTDQTQQICQSYAARDSRVRYIREEQNRGAVWNFNRVFELARGKYFKWAAHDDPIGPEYLARVVEVLDREPSVVLCYPLTMLINGQGKQIRPYAENMNFREPEAHVRWRRFFNTPGIDHPMYGVVRSDVLRQTPVWQDYPDSERVLLGELTLYGEFSEVPEYLFFRRIHQSMSWVPTTPPSEYAAWLNPAKKNKPGFPKWRRLYEYLRAITRAPISLKERLLCYAHIARFALVPEKWIGLMRDLVKALNRT